MNITKYKLLLVSSTVALALSVLVYIQYSILQKDIETNKSKMEFAIPGILLDTYGELTFVDKLDEYMGVYRGTEEFSFDNEATPENPIQGIIKERLDRVMELNYPELEYNLSGFISNEYQCLIHSHHNADLPMAQTVILAENNICLCTLTPNTLDISLAYTNKNATVLGESWLVITLSFLLILVITGAFAFMIYTINRQKKLSDLKKDFINNLTHEFKTPIFSISLAAKSLKASKTIYTSKKLMNYTDLISDESTRLKNQVDKIMQMALTDSGNLTLEKKQLDIHELIEKVVKNQKLVIEEMKGSVTLNLEATKYLVMADETHINNIIYNLLDNALKYSESPPCIAISTRDDQEGLVFIIKDEGIGMEKEQQKFIFDQFYRAQKGDVHNVKGFGLGLSYVKNIVEAHKGRVDLNSEVSKGSEFTIYLPFAS